MIEINHNLSPITDVYVCYKTVCVYISKNDFVVNEKNNKCNISTQFKHVKIKV